MIAKTRRIGFISLVQSAGGIWLDEVYGAGVPPLPEIRLPLCSFLQVASQVFAPSDGSWSRIYNLEFDFNSYGKCVDTVAG
jgi:hypothetical protein